MRIGVFTEVTTGFIVFEGGPVLIQASMHALSGGERIVFERERGLGGRERERTKHKPPTSHVNDQCPWTVRAQITDHSDERPVTVHPHT